MDREKIKLLCECYLSWWRRRERKVRELGRELTIEEEDSGFGNVISGLQWWIHGAIDVTLDETVIGGIYENISWLEKNYGELPFDRLDENDEDYRVLFEVRDLLGEIKSDLEVFVESDNGVDKELGERIQEKLLHLTQCGHKYREETLERHGIKLETPEFVYEN
ncbi:hypothetical protein CL618_03320 [archaeon]|nr:hypothetical protein [archaeon]